MKYIALVLAAFLLAACGAVKNNVPAQKQIVSEFETKKITESNEKYSINIEYPVFTDEKLNRLVKDFFEKNVSTFKSEVKELNNAHSALAWQFNANVSTVLETNEKISLVYTEYQFTGGAHGNTTFKTLVYDKKSQKVLELSDLIQNFNNKKLNKISILVKEQLAQQIHTPDTNWIADGAGPKMENFKNFVLNKEGNLEFYFPQYQVASYADGPQIVSVSLNAL